LLRFLGKAAFGALKVGVGAARLTGEATIAASRLVGKGAVATGKYLPSIAVRVGSDAAALGYVGTKAFTGLARRMFEVNERGIRMTPLAKGFLAGGVLLFGAHSTFNALEQRPLGYVNPNVSVLPQLEYEGVANKTNWDTGADGSLVFALNNLRRQSSPTLVGDL